MVAETELKNKKKRQERRQEEAARNFPMFLQNELQVTEIFF